MCTVLLVAREGPDDEGPEGADARRSFFDVDFTRATGEERVLSTGVGGNGGCSGSSGTAGGASSGVGSGGEAASSLLRSAGSLSSTG